MLIRQSIGAICRILAAVAVLMSGLPAGAEAQSLTLTIDKGLVTMDAEDVTVDALGDMYVGESRPQTIRKFVLDPERLLLGDRELRESTSKKQ